MSVRNFLKLLTVLWIVLQIQTMTTPKKSAQETLEKTFVSRIFPVLYFPVNSLFCKKKKFFDLNIDRFPTLSNKSFYNFRRQRLFHAPFLNIFIFLRVAKTVFFSLKLSLGERDTLIT